MVRDTHSLSASIGVTLYPQDDEDTDTLVRHADQAMYVAKQRGRNRYHLFDVSRSKSSRPPTRPWHGCVGPCVKVSCACTTSPR
jgi:predicted signal transduction protein with EAL and GGDEF domain